VVSPDINSSRAAANLDSNSRSTNERFLASSAAIPTIFSDGAISLALAEPVAHAVRTFIASESEFLSLPIISFRLNSLT